MNDSACVHGVIPILESHDKRAYAWLRSLLFCTPGMEQAIGLGCMLPKPHCKYGNEPQYVSKCHDKV